MPPKEEKNDPSKVGRKTAAVSAAPVAPADSTATKLSGSLRAYKGHLTRHLGTAKTLVKEIEGRDPSEVSARAINELNRSLDKINELRDKVDSLYTELMGLDQDSTYQDNMMRDADTVDKVIAEVLSVLGSIRPAAMTTSADHTSATKPKPNSALKPFTLKRDDTPVVMRGWLEQYEAYHRTSHLDLLSPKDQQAYFLSLLDSSLRARIRDRLLEDTPVFSSPGHEESCVAILEKSFMAKHPLFARRLDFFRYVHTGDLSFVEFLIKLRALGDEAELDSLDADTLLATKAVAACTDTELTALFLREKDLSLARVEELAEQREVELGSMTAKKPMGRGIELARANTVGAQKNKVASINSIKASSFGEWRMQISKKKLCIRCLKSHDGKDCKYKDAVCHHCGRTGHITPACFAKHSGKSKGHSQGNSKHGKPTKATAHAITATPPMAVAHTVTAKHIGTAT